MITTIPHFFISIYFFIHVDGEKARSRGNISSLPKSIAKDKTIFEKPEYAA